MSIKVEETAGPLHMSDGESLLPHVTGLDDESYEYVQNRNRQLMQIRINKVNRNWKEWQKLWAEGSPFTFLAGLVLLKDDLFQFQKDIKTTVFQREIMSFCTSSKETAKKLSLTHDTPTNSPAIDLSPDDRRHAMMKATPILNVESWDQKYLVKIAALFKEYWGNIDINDFVRKVGFSEEQCKIIHAQLRKKGLLDKKRKTKKKSEPISLTGITFIKNGKHFRFGIPMFDPIDQTQNPLRGYSDPITSEPIKRPLMCDHFYVLDYHSWLRQINEHHQHPYTRAHLGSVRNLIELTTVNFAEYKDKIVNLPSGPD